MVDSSVPGDDVAGDGEADDGPCAPTSPNLHAAEHSPRTQPDQDAVVKRHKRGGRNRPQRTSPI